MDTPDPVTPLTPAEQAFVATLNTTWTREQVLTRLKTDLQTAVEIELATIPIYLYTYYSLVRNNESGETISDAQLYANKAGGIIMSVAVEEMLHMSLSSNILWSMGVMPQLYGKAPGVYPTGLPYHNPQGPVGPDGKTAVLIPLGKFELRAALALPPDRISRAVERAAAGQRLGYDRAVLFVHTLPAEHAVPGRFGLSARIGDQRDPAVQLLAQQRRHGLS
jgi:hypothetical protein